MMQTKIEMIAIRNENKNDEFFLGFLFLFFFSKTLTFPFTLQWRHRSGCRSGARTLRTIPTKFRANSVRGLFLKKPPFACFSFHVLCFLFLPRTFSHSNSPRSSSSSSFSLPGLYLGVYAALGIGNSIGVLVLALVSALGAIYSSISLHKAMLDSVLRCVGGC